MTTADLRYPHATLLADYGRAVAGALLCGAPLLVLDINLWLGLVLAGGLVLFALFAVRTALRQRTRYVLSPDSLRADGPTGTIVEWSRIDRMKLNYYSTKRDRSGGWMQLAVGSAGGRLVKIDSALAGFHDIVEQAAGAAMAAGVELNTATRANLRSMGIVVVEKSAAADPAAGWRPP